MSQESYDDQRINWGMGVFPRARRYTLKELLSNEAYLTDPEASLFQGAIQNFFDRAENSRREGNLNEAEKRLQLAQRLVGERPEVDYIKQLDNADVLHCLGLLETARGNYRDAKKYLEDALGLYQEVGNVEESVSYVDYSLGELLRLQARLGDANHYFETALEAVESLQKNVAQAVIHTSVGALHYEREDHKKAIEHLERAMKIDQPTNIGYDKLITYAYLQLARSRERLPMPVQPLRELIRAAEHTLQTNEWAGRLNLLFADLLLTQNNPKYTQEALEVATRTEEHAKRLGYLGVEADALAYRAIAGKRLGTVGVEEMALQSNGFYQREEVVSGLATRLQNEVL